VQPLLDNPPEALPYPPGPWGPLGRLSDSRPSALAAAVAGRERLTGRRARPHDQRNLAVPPAPAAGSWGSLRALTTRTLTGSWAGRCISFASGTDACCGKGVHCNHSVISAQQSPVPVG
jgi:hypothetical protein